MKRPAVFIDRDGTLNEQMGYINHLSRFIVLPGVSEAISLLNRNGFLAIVISNQSGVAQGYCPIELVHEVHDFLKTFLTDRGASLDGIFFCPHHPRGVVPEFTRDCDCRKPGTGLVDQAQRAFEIDIARSYFVGDRCLDMEVAHRSGAKGILVKTGYGRGEIEHLLPASAFKPVHIAEDLLDAVRWILDGEKTSGNR